MNELNQYVEFIKPWWSPPAWLFSPVWLILYTIIIITFGYVFYKVIAKQIPNKVAVPFILNLIFNLAFTPIQFGLQNNLLASIDIILVLITLIWALIIVYKHNKWITIANIPYLLWVLFATFLQLTITYLN